MTGDQGGTQPRPPRLFDGSAGGVLSRTEPKVRAAALAALVAPILLFYVDKLPGVSGLPGPAGPAADAVVTGLLVWAAGYAVRAVDRVDLFAGGVGARLDEVARDHLSPTVVDQLERWVDDLAHAGEAVLGEAVTTTLTVAGEAAQAGEDPLVAARQRPGVLAALEALRGAGMGAVVGPLEAATTEIPAIPAASAALPVALPVVDPGGAGPAE